MSEKKVVKENLRLHEEEAQRYEQQNPEIFNLHEKERIISVLQRAVGYIENHNSELVALDVGCGTGNMLEKLSSQFERVVGMDLSEEMLCRASSTAKEEDNLKLVRGKASDLPFPDNSFDMVSAYSVLHHLPGFSEPISEMVRVLREGGVLYIDHDPVNREDRPVQLYMKFCHLLNGEDREGLPPYEETEGLNREFCDYHIHHGDNGGIPTSQIVDLCEEEGLEVLEDKEYLEYGSSKLNPLHPFFKHFISNEWLFLGRK